ncbi:hypothetical protein K438DRAFT_1749219 [Mycena galopus ATCC 62051]|nr:hypothetical protein K438DRAFT_1749219 [Mycena galopus ATCC 62051]
MSSYLLTSLLALVAAVPNNTIRYSALGLIVCSNALCSIHFKSTTAQSHKLATIIDETEELLRRTMALRPREYIDLAEQMSQLLEAKKNASSIKCRILTSEGGWLNRNEYHVLSNEIAACAKRVQNIRTEAEAMFPGYHWREISWFFPNLDLTARIRGSPQRERPGQAMRPVWKWEPRQNEETCRESWPLRMLLLCSKGPPGLSLLRWRLHRPSHNSGKVPTLSSNSAQFCSATAPTVNFNLDMGN